MPSNDVLQAVMGVNPQPPQERAQLENLTQLVDQGHYAKEETHNFVYQRKLMRLLLDEQHYLCAYSEVSLAPDAEDNLGAHIEHVQPKTHYPHRTFDYHNMVTSALSSQALKDRSKANRFGGHVKGSSYDDAKFVSCLQSDCASFFSYLSDGRVVPADTLSPADKERVQYTIDILNLNSPYLVNKRKNWLEELDAEIDEHLDDDASLACLAAVDLLPSNGQLSPFFSATRQRFSTVAETVLQDFEHSQ